MTNNNSWACKDCTANIAGLNIVTDAPINANKVQAQTSVLPAADYLVITWTEAETDAMARVLSGGKYRFFGMTPDENNFIPLHAAHLSLPNIPEELTAKDVQCHAFYFLTKVNGKSVICLKTNFHPKNEKSNGKIGVPMQTFFKWLASHNNFKYIITTGTSGGIWANMDLGDVVVCNSARYDPNETALINAGKPKTIFTSAVNDLTGSLSGGKNNFDIIASNLNTYASCSINKMATERKPANGRMPNIYYKPLSATQPNTVITDVSFTAERNNIDNKHYDQMGATFDNNDAFVAEAFKEAHYDTWVSIRNISDLPGAGSDSTYDKYQDCSSMIGGLATYAFIMGH